MIAAINNSVGGFGVPIEVFARLVLKDSKALRSKRVTNELEITKKKYSYCSKFNCYHDGDDYGNSVQNFILGSHIYSFSDTLNARCDPDLISQLSSANEKGRLTHDHIQLCEIDEVNENVITIDEQGRESLTALYNTARDEEHVI